MKLNPSNTSIVKRLLSSRNSRPLVSILNKIEPADIASLFTQFNAREKHLLLEVLMHMEKASSALMEVPDSHLWPIFKDFDSKKITKLILSSPSE